MFIDKPQNTMKLAHMAEGITDDGRHYLLRMRQDSALFFYENRDAAPSEANYIATAEFLSEITGLRIDAKQAQAILSLYPQVRIKIAVYDGISDTDVRDGLSFAAAHFFLGCEWPTYGDKVNMDEFTSLLQMQAGKMGFQQIAETV